MQDIQYLIGVDGGGTGTRIAIAGLDGVELVRAEGGASALQQGIEKAWVNINETIAKGFDALGITPDRSRCAVGFGLSGVHNRAWAAEFENTNPGYGRVIVESDGFSTLLGAHNGAHGGIIAVGTGSIGEAWLLTAHASKWAAGAFRPQMKLGRYLGLKPSTTCNACLTAASR